MNNGELEIRNPVALMVRKDWDVSFVPELQTAIDSAVASASLVLRVDTEQTNALQVAAVQRLDVLIGGIERARKAHKEPFLEAGRKIDALAKEVSAPLLEEKARLVKLASDHRIKVLEERRILECERIRKLEEEQRRIRAEQEARDRERFRLEELKRKEIEEAERKAAEAKSKAQREKAAAEAERLRLAEEERLRQAAQEAERQRQEAQARLQTIATMPVPEPPKAEGQQFRDYWDWKSVDCEALVKSYGSRFVKMEVRRQELKDFINGPDCPRRPNGEPALVGIFYRESKQTVRQTGQKAIDV